METIGGVEVFEVGYQQLKDMIASGNVYQPVYNSVHWCGPGTYVIVLCDVKFGNMIYKPAVWCGYVESEVKEALPPQYVDMAEYGMDYRYCRELEVWHVVDDRELWKIRKRESVNACKNTKHEDNFHLYDGCKCVLDLGRYVADTVYVITYIKDWDNDSIDRVDWYKDANDWVDAIGNAACDGLEYLNIERQTAEDLGLYIVDDWELDEGLADGMTVLNAYFRLSVA